MGKRMHSTKAMAACLATVAGFAPGFIPAAYAASWITDVNTDQARYAPGAPVTMYVSLTNGTGSPIRNATVTIYCKHLGALLGTLPSQTVSLAAGASTTLTFSWTPPSTDFQGYATEAWLRDSSGNILDNRNTAVDVSSTWTRFPRYGYVSGYPAQSNATSTHEIWQLKNYHINGVQFYDWQWKHHVPLAGTVASPAASWNDLANRTNYRQTILDLIGAGHGYGMSAMNYNLIYGAWSGYGQDGSGVDYHWGLYNSTGGSNQDLLGMPGGWATPYIFLFNPGDPGWQNYLIGRESDVFAAYPFDGWQVDQIGDQGQKYIYGGTQIDVWAQFTPFLKAAKAALKKTILFNNVGTYGMYDVCANSGEDAVYVECWPSSGQTTYNDLKTVIDQGLAWSGGKGVILPAYMDYDYAKGFSNAGPGTFNGPGVLLTDAAIFASGGSHLELGDGGYMLDNEYFPNHNLLPGAALLATLRNYYDFQVANENLLQGGLANSANTLWLSVPASNNASPNVVWAFTKVDGASTAHVIQLINLMGESNNAWRDDSASYPAPSVQSNITVKYYYGPNVPTSVSWASPDYQNGKMYTLSFTRGSDGGGAYVQFTVPSLAYWDLIYLKV